MRRTHTPQVRATLDGVPAMILYRSDGMAVVTSSDCRYLRVPSVQARETMSLDGKFSHPFAKPKQAA